MTPVSDPPRLFDPPVWLRGPHLQTMLSSMSVRRFGLSRQARDVRAVSRSMVLDCGSGVRLLGLHAAHPAAGRSLVVLLHGWEGSADSNYIWSAATHHYAAGHDVFRLNLRDHGPSHDLNEELFHSCRIDEVVGAMGELARLAAGRPMHLVGYSLGGNFALRVALRAPDAGIPLSTAIAISPVLDPRHTLQCLEQRTWLYRNYFIQKWRRSLRRKAAAWPGRYVLDDLLQARGLGAMTRALVERYTEYPDLATYLDGYALTGSTLEHLETRSHVLTALDDPIIPAVDLARLARPPALTIETTERGGHCAFLDALHGPSWADRRVAELIADGTSASRA
jgi:uncharacterized protein